VDTFQRWRVAKVLGITEQRVDLIQAFLDKLPAPPRPSKQQKSQGSTGLKLKLPPRTNTEGETRAKAKENEKSKGADIVAPEATMAQASNVGVRHDINDQGGDNDVRSHGGDEDQGGKNSVDDHTWNVMNEDMMNIQGGDSGDVQEDDGRGGDTSVCKCPLQSNKPE
jgi:hypothetical protein